MDFFFLISLSDTETQEYMEAENIYHAKSLFQKIKAESSDETSSQQFGRIIMDNHYAIWLYFFM